MLTFNGYVRPDGRVGVRNQVICIPTVNCANAAIEGLARTVPGIVPVVHTDGCETKRVKTIYFTRTIVNYCKNPNNYAVIIVSLGCERDKAAEIARELNAEGIPAYSRVIQDDGGCNQVIRDCAVMAEKFLAEAKAQKRQEVPVSKLTVAIDTPYLMSQEDPLTACAGSADQEENIFSFVGASASVIRSQGGNVILPTAYLNKRKLATEDPIKVISYAEALGNYSGYSVVNPDSEKYKGIKDGMFVIEPPEVFTGTYASGAQIGLFASGKSVPLGVPGMPLIKYCLEDSAVSRQDSDICGTGFDVSFQINQMILDVANGKQTISERNNDSDDLLCIYRRTNWY